MEFEWHEEKAKANLERHAIDFRDAVAIFEHPVLQTRSDRSGEQRLKAIGALQDHLIVVVYTLRSGRRRLISARRAGKDEREAYRQAFLGESCAGQDGLETPPIDERGGNRAWSAQ